jgi:hypothetical protein
MAVPTITPVGNSASGSIIPTCSASSIIQSGDSEGTATYFRTT